MFYIFLLQRPPNLLVPSASLSTLKYLCETVQPQCRKGLGEGDLPPSAAVSPTYGCEALTKADQVAGALTCGYVDLSADGEFGASTRLDHSTQAFGQTTF